MGGDTEERSTLGLLQARREFRGFKKPMLLYALALETGDIEGIFPDDGSDATVG